MKKVILLCIIAILTITSCKKKQEPVIIKKVKLEKGETFDGFLKKYTTIKNFDNNGTKFFLAQKNDNPRSLLFYTKGLKSDLREVLRFKGNILNVFVADINNNKYKELYIISAPLKGNTYETVKDADIFGYTLKDNNSIARLKTEDIEDLKDFNTDKVTLKNNVLSRTYIDNAKEHVYTYELSKNYTLIPKKVK